MRLASPTALAAALLLATLPASAQAPRRSWWTYVHYGRASATRDGFATGQAMVDYNMGVCGDGTYVTIAYGLRAGSADGGDVYWYQGSSRRAIETSIDPSPVQAEVTASFDGTSMTSGVGNIRSSPDLESVCGFAPQTIQFRIPAGVPAKTDADKASILKRVSFDIGLGLTPLRSEAVEQRVASQLAAERAAQADKERAAAQERAAQEAARQRAAQQPAPGREPAEGTATQPSAEDQRAAETARRAAEAQATMDRIAAAQRAREADKARTAETYAAAADIAKDILAMRAQAREQKERREQAEAERREREAVIRARADSVRAAEAAERARLARIQGAEMVARLAPCESSPSAPQRVEGPETAGKWTNGCRMRGLAMREFSFALPARDSVKFELGYASSAIVLRDGVEVARIAGPGFSRTLLLDPGSYLLRVLGDIASGTDYLMLGVQPQSGFMTADGRASLVGKPVACYWDQAKDKVDAYVIPMGDSLRLEFPDRTVAHTLTFDATGKARGSGYESFKVTAADRYEFTITGTRYKVRCAKPVLEPYLHGTATAVGEEAVGDAGSVTEWRAILGDGYRAPDISRASASFDGEVLTLEMHFAPGTFDSTRTIARFAIDTDGERATGGTYWMSIGGERFVAILPGQQPQITTYNAKGGKIAENADGTIERFPDGFRARLWAPDLAGGRASRMRWLATVAARIKPGESTGDLDAIPGEQYEKGTLPVQLVAPQGSVLPAERALCRAPQDVSPLALWISDDSLEVASIWGVSTYRWRSPTEFTFVRNDGGMARIEFAGERAFTLSVDKGSRQQQWPLTCDRAIDLKRANRAHESRGGVMDVPDAFGDGLTASTWKQFLPAGYRAPDIARASTAFDGESLTFEVHFVTGTFDSTRTEVSLDLNVDGDTTTGRDWESRRGAELDIYLEPGATQPGVISYDAAGKERLLGARGRQEMLQDGYRVRVPMPELVAARNAQWMATTYVRLNESGTTPILDAIPGNVLPSGWLPLQMSSSPGDPRHH